MPVSLSHQDDCSSPPQSPPPPNASPGGGPNSPGPGWDASSRRSGGHAPLAAAVGSVNPPTAGFPPGAVPAFAKSSAGLSAVALSVSPRELMPMPPEELPNGAAAGNASGGGPSNIEAGGDPSSAAAEGRGAFSGGGASTLVAGGRDPNVADAGGLPRPPTEIAGGGAPKPVSAWGVAPNIEDGGDPSSPAVGGGAPKAAGGGAPNIEDGADASPPAGGGAPKAPEGGAPNTEDEDGGEPAIS